MNTPRINFLLEQELPVLADSILLPFDIHNDETRYEQTKTLKSRRREKDWK